MRVKNISVFAGETGTGTAVRSTADQVKQAEKETGKAAKAVSAADLKQPQNSIAQKKAQAQHRPWA